MVRLSSRRALRRGIKLLASTPQAPLGLWISGTRNEVVALEIGGSATSVMLFCLITNLIQRTGLGPGTCRVSLGGFYEGPHDSRKRKRIDITYHQPTDRLHIIIDLDRKRLSWNLIKPTKVEVTIAPDKSSFRLDFLGNIETTNHAGRHYNFMKGSWLVATGRLTIPKPRNSSK